MTEINIILIIGLINYILFFLNKKRTNILSCGIMAWAGKDPTKFDEYKFNILGIFNEVRGKHSCGVSVDGTIKYGVNHDKLYRDFVATNKDYINPVKIPIVIGHTRWATGGAHNEVNAHPFGFGEEDNFDFIGVHNGSLHHEKELAKRYDIKDVIQKTILTQNSEVVTYRTKIDSEILLEIIYKNDDFKVLNEYNGAAALVFYNVNEPNVIYCYHGSSGKSSYDSKMVEERPLFYYQENKNSLYISSILQSLEVIADDVDDICYFDYNKVYKITDGDVDKAVIFEVDRSKSFQQYVYNYNKNWYPSNEEINDKIKNINSKIKGIDTENKNTPTTTIIGRGKPKKTNTKDILNIHTETPITNINGFKGGVYFNKLRFWRNGHLISGIYTFVRGHGYYFLDDKDPKLALQAFYKNVNKEFFNGDFVKDVKNVTEMSFIPFLHGKGHPEITEPPLYYFIDGIQYKTELDFVQISTFSDKELPFDINRLSHGSRHPIINLKGNKDPYNQGIVLNGSPYTGIYCMLGSDRIYKVEQGNLTRINNILQSTGASFKNKEEKGLVKIINKDIEVKKKPSHEFTNELVRADLDKMFLSFCDSLPSFINQLEKYGDNKKAKVSIKILENISSKMETLTTL